jgi:hypothetical protein
MLYSKRKKNVHIFIFLFGLYLSVLFLIFFYIQRIFGCIHLHIVISDLVTELEVRNLSEEFYVDVRYWILSWVVTFVSEKVFRFLGIHNCQ